MFYRSRIKCLRGARFESSSSAAFSVSFFQRAGIVTQSPSAFHSEFLSPSFASTEVVAFEDSKLTSHSCSWLLF